MADTASTQLKPKYNLLTAISLVVGVVIGIGIYFRTGGLMAATQGNVHIALWGWIAGAVLSILGALCLAEMGGTVKANGGDLAYARASMGEWLAVVMGIGSVVITYPSINAILAWVSSSYLLEVIGGSKDYQFVLAAVMYLSLFAANFFQAKFVGMIHGYVTIIKLFPLFAIAFAAFMIPSGGDYGYAQAAPVGTQTFAEALPLFFAALIPIVFTFDGWSAVTTVQNEIKNSERNLPIALIAGISFVAVVYICVYTAFINVMPSTELSGDGVVPFGVASKLFADPNVVTLLKMGITLSALGGLNGYTIMTMRRAFGLADMGLFPMAHVFKKVDTKLDVPINSALLMLVMTFLYLIPLGIFGDKGDLSSYGTVLQLFMFMFIYFGLIKMKFAGKLNKGGFHTPFFPLIPVLAILGWGSLLVGIFFTNPSTRNNMLIAMAIYAVGIPIYFMMKKNKQVA